MAQAPRCRGDLGLIVPTVFAIHTPAPPPLPEPLAGSLHHAFAIALPLASLEVSNATTQPAESFVCASWCERLAPVRCCLKPGERRIRTLSPGSARTEPFREMEPS